MKLAWKRHTVVICHIHDKGGLTRFLWLFKDAEVCVLGVKCGGHAQKIEVVASTGKRMRGRQIENDEMGFL